MKERIYRTLNIKLSESGRVFDLLSVQFFIGLANALVNILAFTFSSIPSRNHLAKSIPGHGRYADIAQLCLWSTGAPVPSRSTAEIRHCIFRRPAHLYYGWGWHPGTKRILFSYCWFQSVLIYMVTGYAFWGLVSMMFNVRESRRVFPLLALEISLPNSSGMWPPFTHPGHRHEPGSLAGHRILIPGLTVLPPSKSAQ